MRDKERELLEDSTNSSQADVDLWRLRDAIIAVRACSDVASDELTTLHAMAFEGARERAALGHWFTPFDLAIERMLEDGARSAEVLIH